jgi:hypothetical protein
VNAGSVELLNQVVHHVDMWALENRELAAIEFPLTSEIRIGLRETDVVGFVAWTRSLAALSIEFTRRLNSRATLTGWGKLYSGRQVTITVSFTDAPNWTTGLAVGVVSLKQVEALERMVAVA